MPKFAANLSMMFTEFEFCDRFEAAASCGFKAVEFLWPYDVSIETMRQILKETKLKIALFNTSGGDIKNGEWGHAALPYAKDKAKEDFLIALEYAKALNCDKVHVMAGVVKKEEERELYRKTLCENLKTYAPLFANYGITLTLEALCPKIKQNYLYKSQYETLSIVKELNLDNLKVQFDTFHAQNVDGNLSYFLENYLDYIGHIQVASVSLRHEPCDGEIDYKYLFKLIDDLGYKGYIGLEYSPKGKTSDGLGFLQNY